MQRIVEVYRRAGRFDIRVDPKIIDLPNNRVDLVFEITDGSKTSVKKLVFAGNDAFSNWRLKDVIKTTESNILSFLKNSDIYDPDRIEADRDLLRYSPLIDGDVLPEAPFKLFARGVAADIPIVVGATAEEVTGLALMQGDVDEERLTRLLHARGVDFVHLLVLHPRDSHVLPRQFKGLRCHRVVELTRRVPIPGGTLPGPYYVLAQVNATNTVFEADSPAQGNDVKATLTPLIVGPDLVVSAATPSPRTTAAGTTVAVTNTVRNAGGQATGAFDIGIYVSSSNVYDGGAQLLATRRVTAGLAPGAVSTAITSVALPDTLTAGPYFVIVRADSAGEIGEANENNNSVAAGVTVVVP